MISNWCRVVCGLPDNLEDVVEVRLDLVDSLRQQPAIRSDAHVGHPVDGHQGFNQPAKRMEGGVTRLEEETRNYGENSSYFA